MTKKFYLHFRFFKSNQSLTTEHEKFVKIPCFSRFFLVIFVQSSRFFPFFFKILQILGFPGFQVKWQPCIYNNFYNKTQNNFEKSFFELKRF